MICLTEQEVILIYAVFIFLYALSLAFLIYMVLKYNYPKIFNRIIKGEINGKK